MAINTVIFDFDGTVADTNRVVINSWQYTYKKVHGYEHPEDEIVKSFGEPLEITMKREFPGCDTGRIIDIYRDYQANYFKEMIQMFPGMKELIISLKEKQYNIAVVTSRTRATTMGGLESFGITDYIDCLVTSDDTDRHKPDPAPVQLALDYFRIESHEAIMIGDSMFDIKCAHNAGVKAVLVDWAIAVGEEERRGLDRPDYIIERAEEILDIIR